MKIRDEWLEWLRPVIFSAALTFVGAVVGHTVQEAARERERLSRWLEDAASQSQITNVCPKTGCRRCLCPRESPADD